MRVFVSEYLTCGACPRTMRAPSLLAEGRSMVEAVLTDFARCPDCRVCTTWDAQLKPPQVSGIETVLVTDGDQEHSVFKQLAGECDATFLIAPEFEGLLSNRRRLIDQVGGRSLGCTAEAIELCASKQATALALGEFGVRSIDTARFSPQEQSFPLPFVIKPDDGAGSLDVRLLRDEQTLGKSLAELDEQGAVERLVVQPFQPGVPFSVAALIDPHRDACSVFPPALQRLSNDGSFRYLGGVVPYWPDDLDRGGIEDLIADVRAAIPGLCGYVGFDMIRPSDGGQSPVVVEINPRLTTSYLGYRALTHENLAERMLHRRSLPPTVSWQHQRVEFTPDGVVTTRVSH